jgi:hypothetical protein
MLISSQRNGRYDNEARKGKPRVTLGWTSILMRAAAWKRYGDSGFSERPSDHTLRTRTGRIAQRCV